MLQAVHCDNTDSVQVIVVHNLQLLPGYWPRLTLQQTQACNNELALAENETLNVISNRNVCLVPMFQETLGALVSAFLTDM